MPRSRTYRLRLSVYGTDQFLVGHCRLARLVQTFVPYGTTLAAAVAHIELFDDSEFAAELAAPVLPRFAGDREHFVGASETLATMTQRIQKRLSVSGLFPRDPPVWKLHLAAIVVFCEAEDSQIAAAYRRVQR